MVALAVGEEAMDTARGIGSLLDAGYCANAAIVMEPTAELRNGLNVASASRGQLLFRILIQGLPVHVSYRGHPSRYALGETSEGVSAIEKAQVVQQALLDLDHAWQRTASLDQPHWRPTVYPVAIEGGTSMRATTPERCELWYSTFFGADQDPDAVESEIRKAISNAVRADAWLEEHRPQVQRVMLWPAFCTRTDSAIVGTLAAVIAKVQGPCTAQTGVGYVCDASFVKAHGIDTVVLGPGEIRVAHSFDESVDIEQLLVAAKAYALAAIEWCGRHDR
jgi:acetylornithine deacetylase